MSKIIWNGIVFGANAETDPTVPQHVKDITQEQLQEYDDAVTKKHTHENKSVLDMISSALIEKWNSFTKVEQSSTNGNILINGVDTKVYSLPFLSKNDVGLGNVDNTADKDKSVKHAETAGSVDNELTFTVVAGSAQRVAFDGSSPTDVTIYNSDASTTERGLMSVADKKKVDALREGTNITTINATEPTNHTIGDIWLKPKS